MTDTLPALPKPRWAVWRRDRPGRTLQAYSRVTSPTEDRMEALHHRMQWQRTFPGCLFHVAEVAHTNHGYEVPR